MNTQTKTNDIHQQITDRIIQAMEAGTSGLQTPWHTGTAKLPINVSSDRPYRGINILALWVAQQERGYGSNLWGTYYQWQCLGAQVRKGEKSSPVVFFREIVRDEPKETDGVLEEKRALVARASLVFNAEQVEGYPLADTIELIDRTERIAAADQLVAATGAEIRTGDKAAYWPISDYIGMPKRERFTGTETSTATESYYSVLFHELTHWSGAAHRLNRRLASRFHSSAYAMEEMVAELGAAFLSAQLGIASEPREDHADYLSIWLSVLKSDKKAIFTAASKASQAAEYLIGFVDPKNEPGNSCREKVERTGGASEILSDVAV